VYHANQTNSIVLRILRDHGANPNVTGQWGVHRIYNAAAWGNAEDVAFLLSCGVDPSIRTDFGWAPLHWAAHNGQLSCVRLLMDAGADINTLSDQNTTPLDQARQGCQNDIAAILQRAGALTADEVYRSRRDAQVTYYDQDGQYGSLQYGVVHKSVLKAALQSSRVHNGRLKEPDAVMGALDGEDDSSKLLGKK